MALTAYLTKPNFYSYSGGLTTSDVDDAYLALLIADLNLAIAAKLTKLFVLTPNVVSRPLRPRHASSVISVGTWQKTSLVVKKGSNSTTTFQTLTEGTQFRFYTENEGQIDPFVATPVVIGVQVFSGLSDDEFLQLEGTYGFADGIPPEYMLKAKIYKMLKSVLLAAKSENDTGGNGPVIKAKIDKVETTFGRSENVTDPETMFSTVGNMLDSILLDYDFQSLLPETVG